MLLVSQCLTGANCRYNGKAKPNQEVIDFLATLAIGRDYLLICPESFAKLPIPRAPGEIIGGSAEAVWQGTARVENQAGEDYTPAFLRGAELACLLAQASGANAALLKENSPSCGVHRVHEGSFSGATVPGQGVAALALAKLGITLFNEDELEELRQFISKKQD